MEEICLDSDSDDDISDVQGAKKSKFELPQYTSPIHGKVPVPNTVIQETTKFPSSNIAVQEKAKPPVTNTFIQEKAKPPVANTFIQEKAKPPVANTSIQEKAKEKVPIPKPVAQGTTKVISPSKNNVNRPIPNNSTKNSPQKKTPG